MSLVTSFTDFFRTSDKELNTVDAVMSSIEVVAQVTAESRIAEAIPVIGVFVKALKAKDAVADFLLAQKLTRFLKSMGPLDTQARERMADRLFSGNEQKAGERLLMMLDHATDEEKPHLLGKLFKCFAAGRIDAKQLRRLSMAVDTGFVDDLRDLLNPEQERALSEEDIQDCRRRLVHTGLTAVHVYLSGSGEVLTRFQFTKVGILFYEIVNGSPPSLVTDELFALTHSIPPEKVRQSVHKI